MGSEKIKREKTKSESWKHADIMKGTYCTYENLIIKFGPFQSPIARRTTEIWAAKCKLMGTPGRV